VSNVASAPAPLGASSRSVRSLVIGGATALGAVSVIERGCSFAASLLAARFAGAQVFGAYSLALTTANNVATYAGAGIGTTANRFAGRYRRGSEGYARLVRSLALVSVASSVLAILLLLAGAGPLARLLLRRPDLTPLLQVAAVSAGMMILLECLRGFLIGERLYRPLAVLALCGGAVVIALPLAARVGATRMLACQAAVSGIAIAVCLIFVNRTPATAAATIAAEPSVLPSPGAIWRFGVVQFAGVIGLNAAGWWVAALVARADTTLTQAGLLAVASQLRNLTSLGPNLLTQSSYSLLGDDGEGPSGRGAAALIYCTFVAALISLAVGGTLAAAAGWFLPLMLGPSYRGATLAVSLAMSTAIVHMASAPASARLTMVSLRQTGLINAAWTVLTIGAATWLVPRWGAAAAMGVYFGVHCVAACLVFAALRRAGAMPAGVAGVLFSALAVATALAGLAIVRALGAEPLVSLLMLAVTVAGTAGLAMHGLASGLLPRRVGVDNIRELFGRVVMGRAA
jgi:O-antigen/teichoic acid export membrane protein